ncbi:hypothetical protein [Novosphingobium aquae]|uniref:Sulfotransferase family protein n=1 Tax=Novosphingobium aquae TaxID=3133435 RepID=A0ABU8SDB1_9SPHN
MAMTLADLVSSPDNYLHSFEGDEALFVPMDRAAYRRSIFLDARISPAGDGAMRVPLAMLAGGCGDSQPAMGWIFHVAHCGSTLLARALEGLSDALVLKEPAALRQLGFAPDDVALDLVLAMLARRYDPDVATVVKANVPVNFLLPDIAARRPQDKAIALYWNLSDYLTAILRSDNHRQWLRGITDHFAAEIALPSGASDAIRAAALWRGQAERFLALAQAMPRTATLDAALLFAEPARAVALAAAHFGLPVSPAEVGRVVNGPLFATYSKRPDVAFDNADRLARAKADSSGLGQEVVAARSWIAQDGQSLQSLTDGLSGRDLFA